MIKAFITDKYQKRLLCAYEIDNTSNEEKIIVDKSTLYQRFIGFGGAFTESSAYNLTRVNEQIREEALSKYFSKDNGLGYALGRISIGGCDFSLSSYSYVLENDESLETFNIDRDKELVIPLIKEASKIAKEDIKIIASPWSPPKWMKTNKKYEHGGKLLKEYYGLWSEYICKFINEYRKLGINIAAVTIQNEPAAIQRWDSCIYSEYDEAEFINEYLGPRFEKEKIDTKIYCWDHNRDIVLDRVKPIFQGPASKYVYGVAVHWYDNEPFDNLTRVKQLYPDKHIIHTEGCIEGGVKFGAYESGERYARNIIGDFNNYTEGFIDWNLFLDETGGPNWVNNLCDAPIIINVNQEKLIFEMSYYYIAHFSKFLEINAQRINIQGSLPMVAYLNPSGSIVIVVLNETEKDYKYSIDGLGKDINFTSLRRSIITLVI